MTMAFKIYTTTKRLLADTTTHVSIYLRLRDVYPNSLLLESSDYHSRENSMSFVCCDPIAGIELNPERLKLTFPDGRTQIKSAGEINLTEEITAFCDQFVPQTEVQSAKLISNG